VMSACALTAQVEARLFTFQAGGKIEGDVLQFNDLNTVVVRGTKDGKRYALKIPLLTVDDQKYLMELWGASRKPKVIETTVKDIKSFAKGGDEKHVWIDAVFVTADSANVRKEIGDAYTDGHAGFEIRDKSGDLFSNCIIPTPNGVSPLQVITKGDSVRLAGIVTKLGTDTTWLLADEIVRLSNAEKKDQ